MKKFYSFITLSLIMIAGIFFSACSEKTYTANFVKDEYVLSIGENKEITNDVVLENITLQDLTFFSSDENIFSVSMNSPLEVNSKLILNGVSSGKAILYIYLRGEALDTIDVTVKNQFATPTNIACSKTGLITWDKVSSTLVDGTIVDASYDVKVEYVGETGNQIIFDDTITENSYQLSKKGKYFLSIKANATTYVDESDLLENFEIYYQTVETVKNFKFENVETGESEKATLSWDSVANADSYTLNIDGMKVTTTLTSYEIDLSAYEERENAVVSICACSDDSNFADSPFVKINISKLAIKNIKVTNGVLSWSENADASKYIISYKSLTNSAISGTIETTTNSATLDELNSDAYEISVQAIGKYVTSKSIYTANSKSEKVVGNVAKLEQADFRYIISDGKISYTISTTNEQLKYFEVVFTEVNTGNKTKRNNQITLPASEGVYSVSQMNVELGEVGKYQISVQSLPSGNASVEVGDITCENVVSSKTKDVLDVYVLPSVGTISHSYDENQGSILSFVKPAYETNYSVELDYIVKVNGMQVEIVNKELLSGNYNLYIGNISKGYENSENPNSYEITIETRINSLEDNQEYIGAKSTKNMAQIVVNTSNKDGATINENYAYSADGANKYYYELYKTTDEYSERKELHSKGDDIFGRVIKPEAGYYIIDVMAYSANPNQYLNGYATDSFNVVSVLAIPTLDFGKTTTKIEKPDITLSPDNYNGYYLKINTVQYGTSYEIYLNETSLATVSDGDNDGKIYYYFEKDIDLSDSEKTIKVIAKGNDDFLYRKSENSIIINKLGDVASPLQTESGLKFTRSEGELVFYKNSISAQNIIEADVEENEDEKTYILDLSNDLSDFDIIVYATKENEENKYFLDSDTKTFKVHKINNMTNLYFKTDKVYFDYNDTAVTISEGSVNNNLSLNAIVIIEGSSNIEKEYKVEIQSLLTNESGNIYSFELVSLITKLIAENPEFASAYSQSDKVKLKLIAEASFENEGTYYFSSKNATSKESVEKDYITIEKIAKPVVYFSEEEKKIYWTDEKDKFDYTIKINGVQTEAQPVYNESKSRYEFSLAVYFSYRQATKFEMKKSADNYLDSDYSSSINLFFMKSVQSLNIFTNDDGRSYARFNYTDSQVDLSKIDVSVNNSKDITVLHDATYTSYEFLLNSEITDYHIYVKGYENVDAEGNKTYYVGSVSEKFTLEQLPEVVATSEFTVADGEISWTEYSNVDSPKYQVIFTKDSAVKANVTVETTNLSLSNGTLLSLESGNYLVGVYAINKSFSINGGEKNYYGGTIISNGNIIKLKEVEKLEATFDTSATTIADENSKEITLSWVFDENFKDDATVYFDVYIGDTKIQSINYVSGQSEYNIVLNRDKFGELNNNIIVKVLSDKDIVSDNKTTSLYLFSEPEIELSDEKVLTINLKDSNKVAQIAPSNGFIVKVSVNETLVSESVVLSNSINLSTILGTNSGSYEVEVAIKGISKIALSSIRTNKITGTILATPTITQTSSGIEISSTDENVSYYISLLQNGQEVVAETKLTNGKYTFADNLNGEYQVVALARREGDLTSSKAIKNITISRLTDINNINVTRVRSFSAQKLSTAYNFTWNEVANATSYELSIYNATGNLLFTLPVLTNSISLGDNTIFSTLESGKSYIFGVRAYGNISAGHSNSKETQIAIQIVDSVEDFEITKGVLSWEGSGDYFLYATDGTDSLKLTTKVLSKTKLINEDGSEYENSKITKLTTSKNKYSIFIGTLSGNINLSLVKIGSENNLQTSQEKYVLDSQNLDKTYAKLQSISGVNLNNKTGKITFETVETYQDAVTFNLEYANSNGTTKTYAISLENNVIDGAKTNTYTTDFIQLLDAFGIDKYGKVTITCYITQSNKLRSENFTFSFEQTQSEESDYSALRGENALKDYLMINAKDGREIKSILLKMSKDGASIKYFILEATDYRGYWNVYEDKSIFSASADDTALSTKEVYAILMNNFEEIKDKGNYTFNISYIYTSSDINFGFMTWSENLEYVKLPETSDPSMSNGKITWSLINPNSNITGYYVLFVNRSTNEEKYIYVSNAEEMAISTDMIDSSLDMYYVYLITINNQNTLILASNPKQLRDVETHNELSLIKTDGFAKNVKLSGGKLTINLQRDGSDESYGTILKDVTLSSGTVIDSDNMPYGYGRYYECSNSNLQFKEGQGTFTAIIIDGITRYVRTSCITESDTNVYTINADAVVYEKYNTAFEDYFDYYEQKYGFASYGVNVLSKVTFNYPFVYSLDSLNKSENKVKLIFKDKDSGKEIVLVENVLNLISLPNRKKRDEADKSLKDTLEEIIKAVPTTTTGYNTLNSFYALVSGNSYFTGLACDRLLFDDIGKELSNGLSGEDIQGKTYKFQISQVGIQLLSYNFAEGKNIYLYSLNSAPATICEDCGVLESPTTQTYKVLNEDGITSSYYIKLSPSVLNGEIMKEYVMSFSWLPASAMEKSYKSYTIKQVDGVWRFYITSTNSFVLNTEVQDLKEYILIPLNGENGLNGLGLSDKNEYTVNIFAKGNSTNFSSKTEPITLSFLGFNENITFDEKGFKILGYSADNNSEKYNRITIIYKRYGSDTAERKNITGTEQGSYFNPSYDGLYEYIMFMTTGSVDKYSVQVDSLIYRIENVYKLYSPTVVVGAEGKFEITNNATNPTIINGSNPVYKITNNISKNDKGTDELKFETSENVYKPGTSDGATDVYKETESRATKYYFAVKGSTYEWSSSKSNIAVENGYKMLKHNDEEILYLSSNENSINAVLLQNVSSIGINSDGDVQWSSVSKANVSSLGEPNSAKYEDGETVIVYKVIVEYFYYTSTGGSEEVLTQESKVDTYYTKNTILPATYIRGYDEENDYTYRITVLAFVCKDNGKLDTIATEAGITLQNVKYVDSENNVLTSSEKTKDFTRLNDVQDIAVSDGKIIWTYNGYNSSKHDFKVFYTGASSSGQLSGEYNKKSKNFEFIIDESEKVLSSLEKYTIAVYAFPKDLSLDMMTSFTQSIDGVKILPTVSDSHIKNENRTESTTTIDSYDLKGFFADNKTLNAQIQVSYKILNATTQEVTSSSSLANKLYYNSESDYNTVFEIRNTRDKNEDETIQSIYLTNKQSIIITFTVVTGDANYLYSYAKTMELSRNSWGDCDTITYNSEKGRFEWSFGKETQYYISEDTTYYTNYSGTNFGGTIVQGTIVSLGTSGSRYQQITFENANGEKITGYVENSKLLNRIVNNVTDQVYYKVSITYVITENANTTDERKFYYERTYSNVTDNFFIPEMTGAKVVSLQIQARVGDKNLATEWKEWEEDTEVIVNLFESGEGTTESPYVITNEEQFRNMALFGEKPSYLNTYILNSKIVTSTQTSYIDTNKTVTSSDTKYVFALANDIEIESVNEIIIDEFSAILDGKDYTITFKTSGGKTLNNSSEFSYVKSNGETSKVIFNQFNSIINKITSSGEVKNLKLNIDYTYSPLSGVGDTKTLFAGLVLFNYGKVSNVTVSEMNVDISTEINSLLSISGIVGVNYKTVEDCKYSAQTDITNAFASQQTILSSCIVGFNITNNANITRCEVTKDAKLVVNLSNSVSGIVQTAGIALSNSYGTITLSGNSGTVGGVCSKGTGYSAGVVVYTNQGSVKDCFNAGNVRGTTAKIAGVIGFVNETNIDNLIGVGSLNGSTNQNSYHVVNNYSGSTSGKTFYARTVLSSVVPTEKITSTQSITAKSNSNYKLNVTVSGTTYTIEVVKA